MDVMAGTLGAHIGLHLSLDDPDTKRDATEAEAAQEDEPTAALRWARGGFRPHL